MSIIENMRVYVLQGVASDWTIAARGKPQGVSLLVSPARMQSLQRTTLQEDLHLYIICESKCK
jgi:hypothetical protein